MHTPNAITYKKLRTSPTKEYSVVAFYDKNQDFGWMANTYDKHPTAADRYPVVIDDVVWPSTECYFQAMKYPGNTPAEIRYRNEIIAYGRAGNNLSQFPQAAERIAANLGLPQLNLMRYPGNATWHGTSGQMDGWKHGIMWKAISAKVDQYPHFAHQLRALPPDCIIVEAIPPGTQPNPDPLRANGGNGTGRNELGILWDMKREELMGNRDLTASRTRCRQKYLVFQTDRGNRGNRGNRDLYDSSLRTVTVTLPHAAQANPRIIRPEVIKDYFEQLADVPANNFRFTPDNKFNGTNRNNGILYYNAEMSNGVEFSFQIGPNGGMSGNVDKDDKDKLEAMIETLYRKMQRFNEPLELTLTGTTAAVNIMTRKCAALNPPIQVVQPQSQQTILSTTPPVQPVPPVVSITPRP